MKLQPSENTSKFDLALTNNNEEYTYHGIRNASDDQYVLLFNPERKAFILHQLDSSFNMNLTSTPWDQDAASLKQSYDQLGRPQRKPEPQSEITKPAPVQNNRETRVKKTVHPKKPRVTKRAPTPEPVEDDSDDDMIVEYPDGPPVHRFQSQSTPIFRQEESRESEEDTDSEAEGDSQNQDVEVFALPSPVNNSGGAAPDEEIELDLEAELLEALENDGEDGGDNESSESEEE